MERLRGLPLLQRREHRAIQGPERWRGSGELQDEATVFEFIWEPSRDEETWTAQVTGHDLTTKPVSRFRWLSPARLGGIMEKTDR